MDLDAFRSLFPALERYVYLNTATVAPLARPVLDALRRVIAQWEDGDFSWQAWEREAHATRAAFARLVGASEPDVALCSSLSEAAATVARSLKAEGRVVVGEREFHSNLLPWLALRERGREVVTVPATDGVVRTDVLCAAIDERTALVAVTETQSSNGFRVYLGALAERCRAAGARLFVNLTQSLGALRLDPALRLDFAATTSYKWLLGTRGAAWLAVRPDRLAELEPLAPNWKSVVHPYADYYGEAPLATDARRLDASLAWLPWIGSNAALEILARLDPAAVEARCLALARAFRGGAREAGFALVPEDAPSHIVGVVVPDPEAVKVRLAARRVIAAVRGGFLRVSFHAFNDEHDVEAGLAALRSR